MPKRAASKESRPADLREACVLAAHAVIAEKGIDGLSLRDVARRLGVSHQAPYRHYPTRDHLMAEVIRRGLERFAAHLDSRPRHEDPCEDMGSLGRAYLEFAAANPLEYRLLFGTSWPETADNPKLVKNAVQAFDILRLTLARLPSHATATQDEIALDALFVWAVVHGQATLLQTNAFGNLDLQRKVLDQATAHVLKRIGCALETG